MSYYQSPVVDALKKSAFMFQKQRNIVLKLKCGLKNTVKA